MNKINEQSNEKMAFCVPQINDKTFTMRSEWGFSFEVAKTEFANLIGSSSLLESAFFIKGLRDSLKWIANEMQKEIKKRKTKIIKN